MSWWFTLTLLLATDLARSTPGPAADAVCAEFLLDHPSYRSLPGRLLGDADLRAVLGGTPGYIGRTVAIVVREDRDGRQIMRGLRYELARLGSPYLSIGADPKTNLKTLASVPTLEDVLRHRTKVLVPLLAELPPGTTLMFEGLDDATDEEFDAFFVFMAVNGVRELFPASFELRAIYATHYLTFDADGTMADEIAQSALVIRPPGRY